MTRRLLVVAASLAIALMHSVTAFPGATGATTTGAMTNATTPVSAAHASRSAAVALAASDIAMSVCASHPCSLIPASSRHLTPPAAIANGAPRPSNNPSTIPQTSNPTGSAPPRDLCASLCVWRT